MSGKGSKNTRSTVQTHLRPIPHAEAPAPSEPAGGLPTLPGTASTQVDLDVPSLKLELLASLKSDIAEIFKTELQETLERALAPIKNDLQTGKIQTADFKVKAEAAISEIKTTVGEMEQALTVCSEDVATMRNLIKSQPPGERPRAIICRCHHYKDCVDILRRAKELKRINVEDFNIAVFPDHIAKTAKARAAFNDVRRRLRDIEGARYGLLYPARLRITNNGVEKEFVSAEEASSYVKTLANG
ncbi:hypothetical protein SRHO_G00027910 [Serrasalmus rhombeus]